MRLILIGATAFAASLVSGLLGLGGAVLVIPAYLYLPDLFGVTPLGIRNVSGMTSLQVLASSLLGMWTHKHRGCVNTRLAMTMGIPITAAAFSGAMVSTLVAPEFIVGVFASMAIVGAVLMVVRKTDCESDGPLTYNVGGAVAIALGVGFLGGIVGAPGAFLLSPLMMTVLKIPTRVTIGTTLGVVVLSALATSAGKLFTGQVPLMETLVAVAASLPGAYLGSRVSFACSPRALRLVLAAVIVMVGMEMWYQILF
jgi:uncharacterized membrane protein YfcA